MNTRTISPPSAATWSLGARLLLIGLPALLLIAHAAQYMPFIADDALISLRYADRLLAGDGLTWTAGPPVEGYSNLLWILLDAALGLVGVDLIDGVRLLGVGSTVLVLWALTRLHRSPSGASATAVLVGGAAYVLCGPVAVWSIGGLEQPLVAGLIAWGAARWSALPPVGANASPSKALFKSAITAGLPLGLLCLTRPDGPLIAGLFGLVTLIGARGRKAGWVQAVGLGIWSGALTVGQLAFRVIYYDDWVPNTAHLKAAWSSERFQEGLDYVQAGLESATPLCIFASLGVYAALRGHRRREALLLILIPTVWLGYVASVGGDIFPAHRHMVPALVCLALLGALGVEWAVAELSPRHLIPWGIMATGLLYGQYTLQSRDPWNIRAAKERWEWDGLTLGPMLQRAIGDKDPLLAVTAAGTLPYFSKLRSLDMQGLNDRHIALQPPTKGAWLAHDHGDGKYVLDQKPDLMVFGGAYGGPPKFVSGMQMLRDKRLRRDYRMVQIEGYDPQRASSRPWVRLDGAMGIERVDGGLSIPPYLFEGVIGQPLADGRIGGRLPADTLAESLTLDLPAGRWRVTLDPPLETVSVTLANAGQRPLSIISGAPPALHAEAPARIKLQLKAGRAETLLHRVRITPAPEVGGPRQALAPNGSFALQTRRPQRPTRPTPLATFDKGLDGWAVTGDAFAEGPTKGPQGKYSKRQKGMKGHKGSQLNSYHHHHHDAATGRAISPPFTPKAGQTLAMRIGGGGQPGLEVRLLDVTDGERVSVMAWTGKNSEALSVSRYDLTAHAGRSLRLELIDEATGGWGHIMLDEIMLEGP